MKPFKTTVDFIIKRKQGGVWKYKLVLESTHPNVDDTIILSAAIHKTASVSFRLTNRQIKYSDFQARFSIDSDPEFSVSPKSGILEPYGREGT